MLTEDESRSSYIRSEPVFILGVVFLVFLLITICVLGFLLVNRMRQPSPVVQQDVPVILLPTAPLPTAAPVNYFFVRLPVILTEPRPQPVPEPVAVTVSDSIWRVTKVENLGYALNDQYYDLATFTRLDGLVTAQGYCINPEWDVPAVGVEYSLSAQGIFTPLYDPPGDPLQRFSRIP
jgi:hypothetical protein